MAPRHAGGGAGLGDAAGENGVAEEALRLVQLAGVDVGLAGVAGGVDQELGPVRLERGGQLGDVGVVEVRAPQVAERDALAGEQRLIGLAHVTGATEQIDHEGPVKGTRRAEQG